MSYIVLNGFGALTFIVKSGETVFFDTIEDAERHIDSLKLRLKDRYINNFIIYEINKVF